MSRIIKEAKFVTTSEIYNIIIKTFKTIRFFIMMIFICHQKYRIEYGK